MPEEIAESYVAEVHAAIDRGVPFHRVMLDGYKSILCSPHFLLLEETPGLLDGYALASRLSYFLWNSAPDEQLLAAAANGELATRDGRAAQVERMLEDARVERFERSFVDQWLDLKNLEATSACTRRSFSRTRPVSGTRARATCGTWTIIAGSSPSSPGFPTSDTPTIAASRGSLPV